MRNNKQKIKRNKGISSLKFAGLTFWIALLLACGITIMAVIAEIFWISDLCERICFAISYILVLMGAIVWLFAPLWIRRRAWFSLNSIYLKNSEKSEFELFRSLFLQKHLISTQAKIFISLFIVSLFVSLLPMVEWAKNGVLGVLYAIRRAMQAFVVDGDLREFGVKCVTFYNGYVALLCVMAGCIFTFNIVFIVAKEFFAHLSYWIVHPLSNVIVFSELNDKSIALAENIFYRYYNESKDALDKNLQKQGLPRFYFCDAYPRDTEEITELISRAWHIGAVLMRRDIKDLNIKMYSKHNSFYVIGNDETENREQAKSICDSISQIKNKTERKRKTSNKQKNNGKKSGDSKGNQIGKNTVYIYASGSVSEQVIDAINSDTNNSKQGNSNSSKKNNDDADSQYEKVIKIRRIDEHGKFAFDFFWDHGREFFEAIRYNANEANTKSINVCFLGFGEYAFELLKMLCSLGQLPRCQLSVQIYDLNKANVKRKIWNLLQHQASDNDSKSDKKFIYSPYYKIHYNKLNVEDEQALIQYCGGKKEFTHYICALGDDVLNMKIASNIQVYNARKNKNPLIYCVVKNKEQFKSLDTANQDKNIILVGSIRERYDYAALWQQSEQMAQKMYRRHAIHEKIINNVIQTIREIIKKCKGGIFKDNTTNMLQDLENELVKNILNEQRTNESIPDDSQQLTELVKQISVYDLGQKLRNNGLRDEKVDQFVKLYTIQIKNSIDTITKDITNQFYNGRGKIDYAKLDYEFNREEYHRRSSKSRLLFEKLLFELGYLEYRADKLNINNLVSDYHIGNDKWREWGNTKAQDIELYFPKGELSDKSASECEDLGRNERSTATQERNAENLPDIQIDGQRFGLYSMLQRRWMVFQWGEGYERTESIEDPVNRQAKLHPYLRTYDEIYDDFEAKIKHTIPISYNPQSGRENETCKNDVSVNNDISTVNKHK